MFRVVQFDEDGKYGIQNTLTGYILCGRNGKPRKFRSVKRALKHAVKRQRKLDRSLDAALASIQKRKYS